MEVVYILASWSVLGPVFETVTRFIGITILSCSNESMTCGLFIGLLLYLIPIVFFWLLTGWVFEKIGQHNLKK